jgi:micrococcal nuclease
VIEVIDGDTIVVSAGNDQTELVRLIGIDTPEFGSSSSTSECYAEEAKVALGDLVASSTVRLERDITQADRDVFGRLLRYVYTEDDKQVNAWFVAEGYAREFTYDVPYEFQVKFRQNQKIAKEQQLGIWNNSCN